jgi:hypothetical protein
MLIVDRNDGGVPYPFSDAAPAGGTHYVGDEFVAFGFAEGGTLDEPAGAPTPRVFRGYVQRVTAFRSGGSNPYAAFELSIPAPSGLSGGPVFMPSDRNGVFGVVTGNLESYTTTVEHVEEIGPGRSKTTSVRQIISYGMALSLPAQYEWLRRVSPGAVWISS